MGEREISLQRQPRPDTRLPDSDDSYHLLSPCRLWEVRWGHIPCLIPARRISPRPGVFGRFFRLTQNCNSVHFLDTLYCTSLIYPLNFLYPPLVWAALKLAARADEHFVLLILIFGPLKFRLTYSLQSLKLKPQGDARRIKIVIYTVASSQIAPSFRLSNPPPFPEPIAAYQRKTPPNQALRSSRPLFLSDLSHTPTSLFQPPGRGSQARNPPPPSRRVRWQKGKKTK